MKPDFQQEILAKIKPNSPEKRLFEEKITAFLRKLNAALKISHLSAEAILGGSGAKDTWLAGNYDADIFVLFDYQKYRSASDKLSDLLEPVLKKSFPEKKIRLHGSRDYFQIPSPQLNFEVIPILKIKKAPEAINITDVSPLHAKWVNKKGKSLQDEIRLAKKLFQAQQLYGAESYLQGFSGYVIEILIINYGSLEKMLKAALKWKEKEVIDTAKHYPRKDALFHLNKSKQQSPLIVIDPVDKNRNAAASLSEEKFLALKQVAKVYLKNPSAELFAEKKINFTSLVEEAQAQKQHLIYLELEPWSGKEDVAGARLKKAFEFLNEKLACFKVEKAQWIWNKKNKASFYFFLGTKERPRTEIKVGPPLKLKEYVQDFRQKNNNCYQEKGRILAKQEVKNYRLEDYFLPLLEEKYWQEKIKKVVKAEIV